MASVASPPSARNIVNNIAANNNNTNTNPLISSSSEDPRSLGEQEIGLISRIQEDQENTYNGDGNLYATAADEEHWNESGNGGYKLESDAQPSSSSFDPQPSYNSFNNTSNGANEDQFGTWDPQHPLTALFNPPEPDPIQRSFTAPATSFPLTLQERRLALRNSHMRATPMASSIKQDDVKGLSRAANALRNKHFTSVGRSNTVSSRLSDRTASDDDAIHQSTNRRGSSNFGSLPSIHASLRHRKTPSVEQSGYIEHLEKQISDLNAKLRSYTDPTSDKSHAAIVQRLNAKVRSLENQVNEWEALFDERIRETERINSRERSSNNAQVKLLKDQVETLTQTVANLEDDLDFEKKQNTALTLAVSDKKALAMDNAQLAQALTNALGEIAELEAQAQEREDSLMYRGGRPASTTGSQKAMTLGQLMIDVTPKPRSLETFADLNMPSGTTMEKPHSPFSPTDAAWQTLSPTTSNASTQDMPIRNRKMRKFPSGISAPKQLILSPSSSRRSSVEFVRGHSRNASSSWGSPRLERMGGGRNSLFEELEKMHEDGMVAAIHDETLSVIGSQAPAEVSEAEPEHHRGNSTSPTDTETSDSEDSPQSRSLPVSSPASSSSQPSSAKSSRLGSVGYVLFSPLRVTSAVISSIGRGVLSPRSTLRDMRQRAMEQLIEVSELEESFGSDILFGDQYDEHLRTGGEKLMRSPDLQSSGSMRSGNSMDIRDNMESFTTAMTPPHKMNGTLHRRNRRRASQHTQGHITSDDEVQVVFSGSKSRHLDVSDPVTPCKNRRKSTRPDGNKPILPVKPQANGRDRLQRRRTSSASHGLGIGDTRFPPPYTEYPDIASGVKDDGWRTENSQGEISSSSDDERPGLWISQEQLRALRQDLDRGGLLKAMGISNENNMVLWTKLFIGFMATMFVALRDGPSVALERVDGTKSQATTPVKKRDARRSMDED
ncbi:hypothetical protein TWF481_001851 [Arthrobotrys musiformis]|uniref:Uncharacterized protein n=1 Tax=Arthrobotrys musiformis TaxID=47236 RepID=A0AAV9VUI4_9PEZI